MAFLRGEEAESDGLLYQLLRLDGAPASTWRMDVDGSSAEKHFSYIATRRTIVQTIQWQIVDVGIEPFGFGGESELDNGCSLSVLDENGTTLIDFLDGERLKRTFDFGLLAGDAQQIQNSNGSNPDIFLAKFNLLNDSGRALVLPIGSELRFTIRDDLTGFNKFACLAQGYFPEVVQ